MYSDNPAPSQGILKDTAIRVKAAGDCLEIKEALAAKKAGIDWEVVAHKMDDELREWLHGKYDSKTKFLAHYCILHRRKYGESFADALEV